MLDFIFAILAQLDLISKEEAKKMSKAVLGRPIPDDFEQVFSFVERLRTEAKLSSTRKYFDPADFEKKAKEEVITITGDVTKKAIASKK